MQSYEISELWRDESGCNTLYSKSFVDGHQRAGGPPSWQSMNAFVVLSVEMHVSSDSRASERHMGLHQEQEGRDKTHPAGDRLS